MIAKLGWLLLAISLAFNALFAVRYVGAIESARRHKERWEAMQTLEGRMEHFVEHLDLDVQQHEVFEALLADTQQQRNKICHESAELLSSFLDEIVKDNPDSGVIHRYVHTPYVAKHRELLATQIAKFMRVLNPDQRQKLADSIRADASRRGIVTQTSLDTD